MRSSSIKQPHGSRRYFSKWRGCIRAIVCLVGVYILTIVILVAGERRLAFPGWSFSKPWIGSPAGIKVDDVTITSADGNLINAWWLAPPEGSPSTAALIYIHGNITFQHARRPWWDGIPNCGLACSALIILDLGAALARRARKVVMQRLRVALTGSLRRRPSHQKRLSL